MNENTQFHLGDLVRVNRANHPCKEGLVVGLSTWLCDDGSLRDVVHVTYCYMGVDAKNRPKPFTLTDEFEKDHLDLKRAASQRQQK